MEQQHLQQIIEGALLAYGQPLSVDKIQSLFASDDTLSLDEQEVPSKEEITTALEAIAESCEGRGFELKQVSSGWRFQVRAETASWVNKLWEEKPQRYSRAMLETLAIIAYRQPITRGDIEEIRGVAVSSHIIKTLAEREWVKVVGQRDVPGRPSLYATTRQFLDYFNLASLEELPSLKELADIDSLNPQLDLTSDATEGDSENQEQEGVESQEAVEAHSESTESIEADDSASQLENAESILEEGGNDSEIPATEVVEAALEENELMDIETIDDETSEKAENP